MDFSKYVIDAILSIGDFNLRQHSQAALQLKETAKNVDSTHDAHVLETVSGALSMSYTLDEQKFSPSIVWHDGRRSFAIEDIEPSDVEIIKAAADITTTTWIQAQLSHIAWYLSNDHRYGAQAADSYLKIFEETFDPEDWVQCHDAIQCAMHIASKLGKASNSFKQVHDAINQKLISMDGTDPLFLSLNLLQLVIKDATAEDMIKYLHIISKLADKNINTNNPNTHLADETYSVQELLLKRLKKEDDIKTAKNKYASYYESQADIYTKKGDQLRAVMMLKKSCSLYGRNNREKVLELRSQLEKLQEQAAKNMQGIPIKFNAEPTYNAVQQLFEGLSLQEAIVQLGRISKIYQVDEVKKQIFKKKTEFIFSSLFTSCMLNEKGQAIQELPPLNEVDSNPELLHKHMVHYVSEQRSIVDSLVLRFAFGFFQRLGPLSENDVEFLVNDNIIVPDGRASIIKEGLYWGLSGKLYAAMHILLPQTEHIFRNLVKMCGDTVTFLKEDGTEEYKPLSQLFKSEKLHECYDEDIIFTFQSIMDEPLGENLRNLNAHGILEPKKGDSMVALCFLSLLIKLLVMYSANAKPILKALAERDSLMASE